MKIITALKIMTLTAYIAGGIFLHSALAAEDTVLYVGGTKVIGGMSAKVKYYTEGAQNPWTDTYIETANPNMKIVNSFAIGDSDRFYLAGSDFQDAGQTVAKYEYGGWVARNPSGFAIVNDITFDTTGGLFAGGRDIIDLNNCKGVIARRIYGQDWQVVQVPNSAAVQAVVSDNNGNIYTGGKDRVNSAGQVGIYNYNTNTWTALMNPTGFALVNSLALDSNGTLYAGGETPQGRAIVSKYLGNGNWENLNLTGYYYVFTLAIDSANNLYVGGQDAVVSPIHGLVSKYNGTPGDWTSLELTGFSGVKTLAFDDSGTLYAGGHTPTFQGIVSKYVYDDGWVWDSLGLTGLFDVSTIGFGKEPDYYGSPTWATDTIETAGITAALGLDPADASTLTSLWVAGEEKASPPVTVIDGIPWEYTDTDYSLLGKNLGDSWYDPVTKNYIYYLGSGMEGHAPEPSSLIGLCMALAGLLLKRKKRN